MNSYYGGFRTLTFAQTWKTFAKFQEEFNETPFNHAIASQNPNAQIDLELVYFLLYSRYGNSHAANSDINQFKYLVFSYIFMYGPSWTIRLNSQKAVRELTLDQIREGSIATYNYGSNPGLVQGIENTETIKIDNQNKTLYNKSILEGYSNLLALIETDVTEEFIGKFKKLFTRVTAADEDLLYITDTENVLIEGDN